MSRTGFMLVLIAGLLVTTVATAAPSGCPPGRYFIPGQALVAGPSAPVDDELYLSEISGVLVAALRSGGCPLAFARMRKRAKFTKVTAKFGGCRDVPGRVVVKAKIAAPDCTTLTGRVRIPAALSASERRREFTGVQAPDLAGPDGLRVGAMGGVFTNDADGSSVTVPPGALVAPKTATVSVTEVSSTDAAQIDTLLGLTMPVEIAVLRALQVVMQRQDPAPRSSVVASVPDDGVPIDGTLLHILTEPSFVQGVIDPRSRGLIYDGIVTQASGRYEMRVAAQNFGSPPGLSRVGHIAAGQDTCHVAGAVRDTAGAPVPFASVEASTLPGLAARATADGFYRALVLEGDNTLTVTTDTGTGSVPFVCAPGQLIPAVGVDVEVDVPPDAEVPAVTITDPADDETLGATVRTVTGTVTGDVDRVTIVTHAGTSPDVFQQYAAVAGGGFSTTVILTPGQANTIIVLARDASTLRTGADSVVVTSTAAGGEDLRFTMAWDTDGTDVDLHVRLPGANGVPDTVDGDTIYFSNSSAGGGVLDVDDTDGFGPENIVFPLGAAAPGTYAVAAHYWRGGSTPSTVTVSAFLNGVLQGSFTQELRQSDSGTPLAPRAPGSVFNIATITFPGGIFGPPADQDVFIDGPD